MRTPLDCLPCFMRQALTGARLAAPGRDDLHMRLVREFGRFLADFDFSGPPPLLAGELYGLIRRTTGCDPDLFKEHKAVSNARVLDLLPRLGELVRGAPDPLEAAMHLSIVGNYMDVGVARDFDWEAEAVAAPEPLRGNGFAAFRERLGKGCRVLILGDNAGEIGLDTLLVRELGARGCEVSYAVRSEPVLNDALMEDAGAVGMTGLCRVVESGVDTPGTVLSRCSEAFLQLMDEADLLLSKGQGNYEALWNERPDVFFAFKVKCPVVGELSGHPEGSSVFLHGA